MSFDSLGLSDPLVRAVNELGYTTPTPIQLQAIPAVLNGGDLLAGAQTGTGKTAGFTLPILERLSRNKSASAKPPIRALILTPTRELAAQVEESVRGYGKYLTLRSAVMFGGVGINPQIDTLKRGIDILVATPGRLLDHIQQKTIDLSKIEILVLDEADRMLDMGFIHDIKRVLKHLPSKRQNLLFSATFSDEIKALADGLLDSPALIEVARRNTTAETVAQKIHPVDRDSKRELLTHLIKEHNWFQVLVFTRTKHGANRLAEQLTKDGISALAIHGNKSQSARTRALAEFKDATLQVLVATDIAARGIDIDQLPHVVNFDLPNVPEDYVHRIGRTGRAGATGEAVSLVCVDEHQLLRDIEKLIKRAIPREVIAGFEPDPNATPEPIQRRSNGGGNESRGRNGQRAGNGSRDRQGAGVTRDPQQAVRTQDGRRAEGSSDARRGSPARQPQPQGQGRPQRGSGAASAAQPIGTGNSGNRSHGGNGGNGGANSKGARPAGDGPARDRAPGNGNGNRQRDGQRLAGQGSGRANAGSGALLGGRASNTSSRPTRDERD
jgi:ATP-dependent RNA helicase RhlE